MCDVLMVCGCDSCEWDSDEMLGEWVRRLAKESALVIKFILAMVCVASASELETSSFFHFLRPTYKRTTIR